MRRLCVVLAFWLVAAGSAAMAQIQVSAQTTRSNFMLYERVDLLVTIQNIGDTDLILNYDECHPWLSFLVSKHDNAPVRPERAATFKGLALKAGENKTLRINLTPLFSFRQQGNYDAEAVVDLPGQGQIISEKVPFNIVEGHKVWTQVHPTDGSQRIYSLIRFSPTTDDTQLYLRVQDPDENLIYANIALGDIVASMDPAVAFDPKNCLHVLNLTAMGTYLYTRADADGKVLDQRLFKTAQEIPPRLVKLEDGTVTVIGGLEEDPNTPRERLSDGQNAKKAAFQNVPPRAAPADSSDAPESGAVR
jgi:hypothetical protein